MLPSISVYIGSSSAIIAACNITPDGIYYEQETPILLSEVSAQAIGEAVQRAFSAFSIQQKNFRDLKKTDWPAFRISGLKSVRQFEAEFHHISVEYLNEAGIFARVEMPIPRDEEFIVSTTFNPRLSAEFIGARILGVTERVRKLKEDLTSR